MIPVMQPRLPTVGEVQSLLEEMDHVRQYTNYGPLVQRLEFEYSKFFGVDPKQIVALQNATLALTGAISVSAPTKWYVPDYTFAATPLSVVAANKELVLVDINPLDLKIDLSLLADEADVEILGLVPVMPFGSPIELSSYSRFPNVVIDAAASIGTPMPDFGSLRENWYVVFSLHATKILGCGEGAIVICGSVEKARELRSWSGFGFKATRKSEIVGTNAKMPEMSAAYALTALRLYAQELEQWIAAKELASNLVVPSNIKNDIVTWPGIRPYWIIECDDASQLDVLKTRLKSQGIETRKWWPAAISEQQFFSNSTYPLIKDESEESLYSVKASSRHLGLPMYRGLSEESLNMISEVMNTYLD